MPNQHNPYYYNRSAYGNTGLEQYGVQEMQATPVRAMGSMATTGLSTVGMGAGIGAAMVGMDPMSLGYGAFKRTINPTAGRGLAGLGNLTKTLASGKVGLGRIGVAAGAAAVPALAAYAGTEAVKWGAGQMVKGAGIQAGMESALGSGNFGYKGGQMRGMNVNEVTQMFRDVYDVSSDMKRGVQEITGVVTSMRNLNLTQSISNIREFRSKFKETAEALNTVASEYGVTLREAEAYFRSAKSAGFSTLKDQQASLTATRQAEWGTGLNRAQVQSGMSMGTQLSRAVGGTGWRGAIGMASSMKAVGAGLSSGAISSQMLEEATGKTGGEAIIDFSNTMQRSLARRGSTKFGRYFLAAAARDDMRGLDQEKLGLLLSGAYSMDDIKNMGREAAYGKGREGMADRLLMHEEEMRGQLLQQGPKALMGMVRAEMGDKIYDTENYKVNKEVRRKFGLSKRAADAVLRMTRNMDSNLAEESYQEFERQDLQMSGYASKSPLAKVKADIGKFVDDIGKSFQQAGQKVSVGLRDTANRFISAVAGQDYTPIYDRKGPVTQNLGSRNYIRGLLGGRFSGGPQSMGTEGALNKMRSAYLGGHDPASSIAGGSAYKTAGFDTREQLSAASSGLGGAWEDWAVSKDLALTRGVEGFSSEAPMSQVESYIGSIRRSGGRLADYLGDDPKQAVARYTHLARKYASTGSALNPNIAGKGGRRSLTGLSDARVNEIKMGMLSPQGAFSEITHSMPEINFGKPGLADRIYGNAAQLGRGIVGLGGHLLNLGGRAASEGEIDVVDMEDSFADSLKNTAMGALSTGGSFVRGLAAYASVGLSEVPVRAALHYGEKAWDTYIDRDDEEKAADSAQRFRGLMGSKAGALLVNAAKGDQAALEEVTRMSHSGQGLSPELQSELTRYLPQLHSSKGRANILKAAPLIHSKQIEQYKSRVKDRMTALGSKLTNYDRSRLSDLMGGSFKYKVTDPSERGSQWRDYLERFTELDDEDRKKVVSIYSRTGRAGSEFTTTLNRASNAMKMMSKMGMDKGGVVRGRDMTKLLRGITGQDFSKENIDKLISGEMSGEDFAQKYGLTKETMGIIGSAVDDKELDKEEAKKLIQKVGSTRSGDSYIGSDARDALGTVVDLGSESSYGSAKGMHKELQRQTGILSMIAKNQKGIDKKLLNKILGKKPKGGDSKGTP